MTNIWKEIYIPLIFLLIVLPLSLVRGQFHIIMKDVANPYFQILFISIFLFSIWGLKHPNLNVRFSTQRSINALMIAYLAHIDMPFTAYVITWITVYYFNEKLIIDDGTNGKDDNGGISLIPSTQSWF